MAPMEKLRVIAVNTKGHVAPFRFMLKKRDGRRPDVGVVNEGVRAASVGLGKLAGYRRLRHLGGRDDKRAGKDVQVLTQKKLVQHAALTIWASEEVQPERIAPDRNIIASAFGHDVGKTAVIGIHPNAVTVGLSEDVARVRETAELVKTLGRTVRYFQGEGFHVVIAGDGNWREGGDSPGWRDIAEMCHDLNLSYSFHGLEFVAWSDGLELADVQIFSKDRVQSDHPGALYDFVASSR